MEESTARGLATAIGRTVSDGLLSSGDRLPPIRTIATKLGLSPTTVSAAWAMLARTGTVTTDGRHGTLVATRRASTPRYRRAVAGGQFFTLDLSTGSPDPALLPNLHATLSDLEPVTESGAYRDQPGVSRLAELLRESWPFAAQELTVVDGSLDGLQAIASIHLRFGDRVAVENPAFPPLLDILDSVGVTPIPVDVDDDGPDPDQLATAVHGGARAVFLQPRAQNPTGAALTQERAERLADVLRHSDVLVIEDDSAAISTKIPATSLGGFLPSRTLHVRSYSKVFGPELRLAALGGPSEFVTPIIDRRRLGQGWSSRILQGILVDLLTRPEHLATVERAQELYAQRWSAAVSALAARGVQVNGKGGLNIWVPVMDESAAQLLLATHGIGALPGRPFAVRPNLPPHLRVTVGLVTDGMTEVTEALADAAHAGTRSIAR
jgi:DNA-binding transcriptional MocR family regulator